MFKELSDAIVSGRKDVVVTAVEKAIDRSIAPAEIIEKGLAAGMNKVDILFERGELFLSHVMMSAGVMEVGLGLLEADMPEDATAKKLGVIVNGTVEGDLHDVGKSIVSTMLQSSGFEVHDIGRDVPLQTFIDKIRETGANMVGISALMTTTLPGQKEVIEMLKEQGLRDNVKVMVGGAPATRVWAERIGADCYAENASEAVAKARELLI